MARPKILFAGTPDFATTVLAALIPHYEIVAVYTQPDRPAGRGRTVVASPVKQLASKTRLPVEQPVNFKDPDAVATLEAYQADLMIVVAYGLLLPKSVLTAPRLGCVNVHASLLPRWRGAAPIQRAIEAGDQQTGVAIMQMDEGLDTGPVWQDAPLPITKHTTAATLHDQLAKLGANLLLQTLPNILAENGQPKPQDEAHASYAKKLHKTEAEIQWKGSAFDIERKVRAFNSWPVAYFAHKGINIRVWSAEAVELNHKRSPGTVIECSNKGIIVSCGKGALALRELQLAGSKRMALNDLLNSKADWFRPGTQFGAGG